MVCPVFEALFYPQPPSGARPLHSGLRLFPRVGTGEAGFLVFSKHWKISYTKRHGNRDRFAINGSWPPHPLRKKSFSLKQFLSFLGPGFLVTVGFIDPGNWATNIEGGSKFGYQLLWVITLSTLILIVIQHMAAKLGIATGKSLAVNIRERFPAPVSAFLGVTILLACVATDVAELIGGAIGFNLLLGLPLWAGALLTVFLEVFLIVSQRYHRLKTIIIGFLGIIACCYVVEILIVKPDWAAVAPALIIPHVNRSSIYVAMAILGAVVMPHNIFLHSNVIHSRKWGVSEDDKKKLLQYEKFDTLLAMILGWVVNSAMIIVAAAVFSKNHMIVTSIE